jgi:hypothetical protein
VEPAVERSVGSRPVDVAAEGVGLQASGRLAELLKPDC